MSIAKKSIKWLVAAVVVFALILTVSLAVGSGATASAETEVDVDVYVWVEDSATGLGRTPVSWRLLPQGRSRSITAMISLQTPLPRSPSLPFRPR